MTSLSANAITTKAKAMYGRRLRTEDYHALVHKKSVAEIAAYLKNETDYASTFANVKENEIHRGDLEALLKKDMFERGCKLAHYADGKDKELYEIGILKSEVDLILGKIRIFNSSLYSEFESQIPLYLNRYTSFDLNKLKEVQTYPELCEMLARTDYAKILLKYMPKGNDLIDYPQVETALTKHYYDRVIKTIKRSLRGKTQNDCMTVFLTGIELQNISKIYRLKKYYHADAATIRPTLMLDYLRISKSKMEELIEAADAESFLRILANSPYRVFADNNDYVFIEYYADKIKYHLAERHMRFSTSSAIVFLTYTILHEIEMSNLINIIEGVRYGVSSDHIEKTCIY